MQSPAQRILVNLRRIHPVRLLAWVYAAMFLGIVLIGYIPAFTDDQGQLFGLFRIELIDDALHLGSAIWAAAAAWRSARASTLYFRLFGTIYMLDGIVGFLFGQAFLDGGIVRFGPADYDWFTKFAANLPHIVIGGTAIFIGFAVARRYEHEQ